MQGNLILTVEMINPKFAESVPQNSYVILSDQYIHFELGVIPPNWRQLSVFGEVDQQKLFLFHVD